MSLLQHHSSKASIIGIGCVLISERKRRREVREDSSLTATFSQVFTSLSGKGWQLSIKHNSITISVFLEHKSGHQVNLLGLSRKVAFVH